MGKLTKLADHKIPLGTQLHPWSRIEWQGKKDKSHAGSMQMKIEVGPKQLQDLILRECYTKETANGESQLMNKTKMAHQVLVFNDTVNTAIYNNLRIFL